MSTDPRVNALLAERVVSCTLRKQPKPLTTFFYDRLKEHVALLSRPDAAEDGPRMMRDKLFTFLKFIGKPNDVWRKEEMIKHKWPPVREELAPYLEA